VYTIKQVRGVQSDDVVQTVLSSHTESKPWGGNA
jgi:hypothetical protein